MRRDGAGVLYTSLAREGALAEISFHWGQLSPRPTKPVVLHTLRVVAHRTLRLVRASLATLGVPDSDFGAIRAVQQPDFVPGKDGHGSPVGGYEQRQRSLVCVGVRARSHHVTGA